MKHTKIFKNMLAVFSAAAVAVSGLSITADALEAAVAAPYTVFMSVQAGTEAIWEPAEENVATVEGDGTYELSYTFVDGSATIAACIIDSDINAYSFAPEGCADPIAEGSVDISVESIKITRVDGTTTDVAYTGRTDGALRTGDDGKCVRLNILNEWQTPNIFDIDKTLPGDGAAAGDVLTVTLNITGLDGGSEGGTEGGSEEEDFTVPEGSYYTFMSIQAGTEALWASEEQNTAVFTEDGSYEMSYTFVNGSATIAALIIDSNINAYDFAPEGCADPIAEGSVKLAVDSITLTRIDGTTETVEYTGPTDGAFRTGDDGASIRLNILNEWQTPNVFDISKTLPGDGAAAGDKITVAFTITGLGESPFSEASYGDIDGDGEIGLSDATLVLAEYASVSAGLASTLSEAQFTAADVDADGSATLNDATAIISYYAAAAASLNPALSDYFPAAAQ